MIVFQTQHYTVTKVNLALTGNHGKNIRFFVETKDGEEVSNYEFQYQAERKIMELESNE